MQLFVFQSGKDAGVTAFTAQRDGGNLPADLAPWKFVSGGAVREGADSAGIIRGLDAIQAGIARDGYFIARGKLVVNRRTSTAGS